MNELDRKINQYFPGLVVRKDLVKLVKGNAIVPTYVLEYLLGQYCATSDEDSIQAGVETVREILRNHFVHRNEANLVKSTIRERGYHKVIDKVSVALNEKNDAYEAAFANLGISNVLIGTDTVKRNPKLLVSGVWCIAEISYQYTEDTRSVPWILESLKPIQMSSIDFDAYLSARDAFSQDEWVDFLLQTLGFNPAFLSRRKKLLHLTRLIPYCERNYNLIELGPKGTGKSHIYSEFSPHGILLSGGEVTVPKLFVNNSTGKIGLVGYWDAVAFDEFAGKKKRSPRALVDIMKNYMANKSFSRGIETLGAEASFVFVGNTSHPVAYLLRHENLFADLPKAYYDSAFLDRIHYYLPGWEMDIIRGEMFTGGYGFIVDYLAEILRELRDYDYSLNYTEYFELLPEISTRDRDAINKTFSGLMKILYPRGTASPEEMEPLLAFAIEGRKRTKEQLMRIDNTYAPVRFGYRNLTTQEIRAVQTLEEKSYPQYFQVEEDNTPADEAAPLPERSSSTKKEAIPQAGHLTFAEDQTGVSYDKLFGPYLHNAKKITITDPYIRSFYQVRNLMEFLETVARCKGIDELVTVKLITTSDPEQSPEKQDEYLQQVQQSAQVMGIDFDWEYTLKGIHARHIVTDTGWKISLDRGLDIFQPFNMNDLLSATHRLQEYRSVKAFEVTYLRLDENGNG